MILNSLCGDEVKCFSKHSEMTRDPSRCENNDSNAKQQNLWFTTENHKSSENSMSTLNTCTQAHRLNRD